MAPLLSPRRADLEIELHARVAPHGPAPEATDEPDLPRVGWLLASVAGALSAAVAGWILVVGLTVIGWLAADPGTLTGAMGVGTQLWLLSNGSGAKLGSTAVTLVPWGATFVCAFLVSRFARFAARYARERPLTAVAGITSVMVLAYAAPVVATAQLLDGPDHALRGLVFVGVIVGLSAAWGSSRALGYSPTQSWPTWCRAIPRAVLGAQLAMVVTGAAALTASLVVHFHRVLALTTGLHAGLAGGVVLEIAQFAFLPNAVIWAASYTLGAGFSFGQGSVVAPASTQFGLLPAVPLLGALPSSGPGNMAELWWLAAGVVAGGVAAWLVMRARPAARFDETSLVGGLSGLLGGVVFVALAWASGGDLGASRLAGLGPRLAPLLMLSASTMGLAGMLVGLVLGLLRRPAAPSAGSDS
jgi:hypothetical protein